MQLVQRGYTGLVLVVDLNRDRLISIMTVLEALGAGAALGSLF